MQAITRRLDLVTAVARLLLENEGYSESRTLQRCARLIARELTAWVIVDMDRGHRVRRQFVAGPDDPRLTELTSALAAVDPPPGSVDEPKAAQAWWKKHEKKSLHDLQLEVLHWTIDEEAKHPDDFADDERVFLQTELERLQKSDKATEPTWWIFEE